MTRAMDTTAPTAEAAAVAWRAPGKGDWRGLHDHFPRPLTPEYQSLLADGMRVGEAVWLEAYGFPVRTISPAFVHGRVFISPEPLVGPPSDRVPPAWAVRLAVRLVPAFRRRAAAAERTLRDRPWLAEADHWFTVERPEWQARNEAFAAVDVSELDDDALVEHLRAVRAAAGDGYRNHFRLHGCDLIPVGLFLVRAVSWGIDPVAAAALLAGSSPVSTGSEPLPAWCLVTGYDLEDRCAGELPDRGSADAVAAARTGVTADPAAEAGIRSQVPADERTDFDRLLADARATYGVRDSNGLLTAAWPVGLLRRAMLEVGRRLVDMGELHEAEHAVELSVGELVATFTGRSPDCPVGADEAAARLAERRRLAAFPAPTALGAPADIPLPALPPAMRTMTAALIGVRDLGITMAADRPPLQGVGIGTGTAVGTACVTLDPADALTRFEPGAILVTAGTCPAWNSILALAGGVVTEEGGPLSHAAVIARELGLPAVVGCAAATTTIPDGATIELDIATGSIRVLDHMVGSER